MKNNAIKINPADNVAIVILPVKAGDAVVINDQKVITAVQDVAPSHKIALSDIKNGQNVIRYGEPIIRAMTDIRQGEWIHIHNAQPLPGDPDK